MNDQVTKDIIWAGAITTVVMLYIFLPERYSRKMETAGMVVFILVFALAGLALLGLLLYGMIWKGGVR